MSKYNRKDNDGHKYKIPTDMLELFDTHLEMIDKAKHLSDEWYAAIDKFNYQFEEYMVG